MARLGDKGNSGEVGSGGEYVALTWYQCPAECGIEEILLVEFPGCDLAHLRPRLTRGACQRVDVLPRDRRFRRGAAHRQSRHHFAAILRLIRSALGIEAGHEAVLDFVGVGKDVALVEFKDISEVIYSGYKAVDGARLDDMLPLSPDRKSTRLNSSHLGI